MILFFDTETTGKYNFKLPPTAPCQPHLVQLAFVAADMAGKVLGCGSYIIEPDDWVIPDDVAEIHGISNMLAHDVGVPRRLALASFNNFCKKSEAIVAHNINFDKNVMMAQYYRENVQHRMDGLHHICTMTAATDILKLPGQFGNYKWPTLTEAYAHFMDGAQFGGAHNAMNDVLAMMKVFYKMVDQGVFQGYGLKRAYAMAESSEKG